MPDPYYLEPVADSYYMPFESYIVPPYEESPSRNPPPSAPSYEQPWWVDTINRSIERAAQVATLEVAGYPPYPSYPTPAPAPMPVPAPVPAPGVQTQPATGLGFQISPTTALIVLALGFAFFSGRGRR